ncbi:hypothetical protein AN639_05445 [Candidatus Epulonipiscium fishelsonii]|uniref:Uncharacterized protein n=1 Tax=Candidatus Epulonipiscium fishelsonii TaxID=77094 RepID=A0ACC8XAT1_9FIRM|nr:hypothetical protein AN396_08340 [Epulopiscium sp. SCG-B11WGA-EpuloA1]ONI40149.1 hypothetical protein AN639_05445 [Epulopiscium sp. SCG-B05WGA-EpuloA1]
MDKFYRKELETYSKDYKIFIDTCSILEDISDQFWDDIVPLLHQYKTKIIIPKRVCEEIEAKCKDDKLSNRAKKCLENIKQLQNDKVIEIKGDETDNFADNVFQVVFTKFRMSHKLLLITQDNNLAKDILALNKNKSVQANTVKVRRLDEKGCLSEFSWAIRRTNDSTPANEVFDIKKVVSNIPEKELNKISTIPKEQSLVYLSTGGNIRLLEKIATGGEGIIYKTMNPNFVAKIYKKDNNTRRTYEKIQLIISKNLECQGICFPKTIIYNENNEFVGYLMPLARGKELQKSIFIKPLFIKNFPNWKKRDTVELCVTLLNKIQYLHDRNIIMGDINPANILVVSPTEIYFVDTDSYQIEEYPCPVGTINYTAPEIQRKHFSTFLRTIGHENFAVATLLFMIMLPGKPPYSQQGGEDPVSNIIKMDFSYPFKQNSNKRTPDGPWRYIWSHLTYDLKEEFYNTFRKDGDKSTEDKRLKVNEWLNIFKYYLLLLDSGTLGTQDKMSEELFPTRHKKTSNTQYISCMLCKNEIDEKQCRNGICRSCLALGETYYCKCGKEIFYSNNDKYVKNFKKPLTCLDCFSHGKQVHSNIRCIECGVYFDITNNELDYFNKKGLDVPKRCPNCRKERKNNAYNYSSNISSNSPNNNSNNSPNNSSNKNLNNNSNNSSNKNLNNNSSNSSNNNSNNRSKNRKGSLCFITTVVCQYYGKPDDCEELTILRNYRDNWLSQQVDGKLLIAEYYNTAPLLVSLLCSSSEYEYYCELLWKIYIIPCIELIKNNKLEECKNLYIAMVQFLDGQLRKPLT